MRVLIVEDNLDLAANVGEYLTHEGYQVDFAYTGLQALNLATAEHWNVIVLDLMLPEMDGLEVAQQLRQQHLIDTPILMLTARDQLEQKLDGFAAGADDYLVKPFELKELAARIRSLAARAGGNVVNKVLAVEDIRYHPSTQTISRGERTLKLKPTTRKLLIHLLQHHDRVVSRDELCHLLWGDEPPDSEALRVHIHAIRKALHQADEAPILQTIRGSGYRLALETNV